MIMKDVVTDLILKMDVFMTKEGNDIAIRKEVISLINSLNGEDSLETIYINTKDNFNIPDVVVLPLYNKAFNVFLMDDDFTNTCPFGYTIEIHNRCFKKYTAEELVAVMIHDILQNVQSFTARTRFLKAYNRAIADHTDTSVLDIFGDISSSEVMFIGFMDICTRPFRMPADGYDYVGTDEVLVSMNLADAYDSYLKKSGRFMDFNGLESANEYIQREINYDYRTLKTIVKSCMDRDIRHYYTVVLTSTPLVSLENIFAKKGTVASLGFISRQKQFKKRYEPKKTEPVATTITESFINPKNEVELRFQLDKIISEMRYAETEAEREVIMFKIKNMNIKLVKTRMSIEQKLEKKPGDKNLKEQYDFVCNMLEELEMLRDRVVKMDIHPRQFGLFVKYPKGYEG